MRRAIAESVNVAEAKKRLSDLLGRVAYGGETVLITRRGRPMARLVPAEAPEAGEGLAGVRGWLEDADPFFGRVDEAVAARRSSRSGRSRRCWRACARSRPAPSSPRPSA